jgi:hypothetical protein
VKRSISLDMQPHCCISLRTYIPKLPGFAASPVLELGSGGRRTGGTEIPIPKFSAVTDAPTWMESPQVTCAVETLPGVSKPR